MVLSMGEPAGIGGEITLKAWNARQQHNLPPFFVIDDPDRLGALASMLGLEIPVRTISEPGEALTLFDRALPVLPLNTKIPCQPGQPDLRYGPAVIESVERATELVLNGQAAALVTNPIHKASLLQAGFEHPGHTGFLAALCRNTEYQDADSDPVMMLAIDGLRVVPVTVHIPVHEIAARLTSDAIIHAGAVTNAALKNSFGISKPRIAVAALNPHAGESGNLGGEEAEIIGPAIKRLQTQGVAADGPFPADSLFHQKARAGYDAVLCMYHDQALIPLKTLDFENGVNITLGLPIIRTSPDHGTALDIAAQTSHGGCASPASLVSAILMAARLSEQQAKQQDQQSRYHD